MQKRSSILRLSLAMVIFGTIGVFRRFIPLSSSLLAVLRGLIGATFLLLYRQLILRPGQKADSGQRRAALRKNFALLVFSGALIGLNWMLLFEAYQHASVAVATLCYYMAPVFVTLASPFVLGERLTGRKLLCAALALVGMALVSGVLRPGQSASLRGVLLGLGAAALYACVVLLNKRLKDVQAVDQTIIQLAVAGLVLVPFSLGGFRPADFTPFVVGMLLFVGVVHTGFAYVMYFGSMNGLRAQSVALLSYIDPVVAVLLSWLLLREPMGVMEFVGALLVLGSTIASEIGGSGE